MYTVPNNISSPVFFKDPRTVDAKGNPIEGITQYRIIDLTEAKKLVKQGVAYSSGTIRRKVFWCGRKSKPELPLYELKRDSGALLLPGGGGESARMGGGRGRNTNRRLIGLANNHLYAKILFGAWKPKVRCRPVQATANTVKDRAILYFPLAGMTTAETQALKNSRRKRV